ncbi:hypothetical protein Tco_1014800 [Tanacetum coccineum]
MNRYPISTLLQENPDSYKNIPKSALQAVRFTAEATITRINTARYNGIGNVGYSHPSTPTTAASSEHIPLPSPPSAVKLTAATTSEQITESSIPVSTIATPPNTSETMQAANTGHLDKTEKTTTKRPKTLKRTLFPSEPRKIREKKQN